MPTPTPWNMEMESEALAMFDLSDNQWDALTEKGRDAIRKAYLATRERKDGAA